MATVVASAVESCRPLMARSGHELHINLPARPLMIDADPVRFSQILLNLLDNAAKYTAPGGPIHLAAEQQGTDAVIAVRANGVGISADMLAGIFDMFTQVDRSVGQSQGGLGIGLTLVRRLVEMHGGTIEAHSGGADQGSESIVRVPLLVEAVAEPSPAPAGPTATASLTACCLSHAADFPL